MALSRYRMFLHRGAKRQFHLEEEGLTKSEANKVVAEIHSYGNYARRISHKGRYGKTAYAVYGKRR